MIVDTNVIITVLVDPTEFRSEFATNNFLCAPSLIDLELINVYRKLHYLKGLDLATISIYEENTQVLIDEIVPFEPFFALASRYSFELNHPIYDCIYLACAQIRNDTFVSMDRRLLVKAESKGIKTILFE
jgi:predicted nucleic acid-binding protein